MSELKGLYEYYKNRKPYSWVIVLFIVYILITAGENTFNGVLFILIFVYIPWVIDYLFIFNDKWERK